MTDDPAVDAIGRSAWRSVVDSVAFGVVVLGTDGRIRHANGAAAAILGVTIQELLGIGGRQVRWAVRAPDGTAVPPDRLPGPVALRTGAIQEGVTLLVTRPDGAERRVRVTAVPDLADDGTVDAVVSTFEDVTPSYGAEQALLESELRYRLLAENAADVVARADPTGHLEWLSPSVRTLLGYEPEGLVGHDLAELVHPEDRPTLLGMRAELGAGSPARADLRLHAASGEWRWFRISANVLRDAEGRDIGRVGGWLAIDDEVREREERERTLVELADAQAIARVGSWTYDRAGGRSSWTDELYRLHGIPPGTPIPADPGWYDRFLDADTAARIHAARDRTLASGEPFEVEHEIRRPDGSVRHVIARAQATRDASGRITGARGTVTDITHLVRRHEAARRWAAQRADYVVRVAHRLRTSLGVVSGWAELLAEQGEELDVSARALAHDAIARNAARLATAIESLLTEMVEEARSRGVEPVPLDVSAIAARVVREHCAEADAPAIAVTPLSGIVGLASEDALATALHLAIGYLLERDGLDGALEVVTAAEPPERVRIVIRDGAPPLAAGEDPFAAFGSPNGSRPELGLHLVRTLMEAMGGTADAHARADAPGLEVVLRLQAPEA